MKRKSISLLLALMIGVLGLAGCGNDSSAANSKVEDAADAGDETEEEKEEEEPEPEPEPEPEITVTEPGETITIGDWEITVHEAEFLETFEFSSSYYIEAEEGQLLLVAGATLKNIGEEEATFLPMVYYEGKDVEAEAVFGEDKSSYPSTNVMMYSDCLSQTKLEAGEEKSGDFVFEVDAEEGGNEELGVQLRFHIGTAEDIRVQIR